MGRDISESLEDILRHYQARTFQYGVRIKLTETGLEAWGNKDTKVIEISNALLAALTPAEVEAVLAHEIGHIALGFFHRSKWYEKRPTPQMWASFSGLTIAIIVLWEATSKLWQISSSILVYVVWPILFLFCAFLLLLQADWQKLDDEYAADLIAAILLSDPCQFKTALERIYVLKTKEFADASSLYRLRHKVEFDSQKQLVIPRLRHLEELMKANLKI